MAAAESLEWILAAYLEDRCSGPITDLRLEATQLHGGYVSRRVQRLDAEFIVAGEHRERRSFVKKSVTESEAALARLLKPIVAGLAVPALVAGGRDAEGDWILIEFIDGPSLGPQFALPPAVLETLLCVHAAYAGHLDRLSFLPVVDGQFWQALLDAAWMARLRTSWPEPPSGDDPVRHALDQLRRGDHVARALGSLPRTLLHGDVHGGNMIASVADGRVYLIDWGSARLGAAAIDLVNCVDSIHSPTWKEYWGRMAQFNGNVPAERELRVAFHTASAIVNVQYVPFALSSWGGEQARLLLEKALDAVSALEATGV